MTLRCGFSVAPSSDVTGLFNFFANNRTTGKLGPSHGENHAGLVRVLRVPCRVQPKVADDVEVAERTLPPGQQPVVDALPVEDVQAWQPPRLLPGGQGVEADGALGLLAALPDHHQLDAVESPPGLTTHLPLPSLFGVEHPEPLDVVEEEPSQGDHHENNERNGDEHDRPTAVWLQAVLSLLQIIAWMKRIGTCPDAAEVVVSRTNIPDTLSTFLKPDGDKIFVVNAVSNYKFEMPGQ